MSPLEQRALDIGAQIATSLVDRGLAALADHAAVRDTAAEILARLDPSPADVTVPYHEARRALLGDDDEETTG